MSGTQVGKIACFPIIDTHLPAWRGTWELEGNTIPCEEMPRCVRDRHHDT